MKSHLSCTYDVQGTLNKFAVVHYKTSFKTIKEQLLEPMLSYEIKIS